MGRPSPIVAGLRGRCPYCGDGDLFRGFLTLAPRCECCGASFDAADAGDGPAVFVMLIAGFLVVLPALVVEVKFAPPLWVHLLLWIPLTLIACLFLLRPVKGLLVALQFHHKAEQGREEDDPGA